MAPPRHSPEPPGRHDVLWVVVAVVFMLVALALTVVILRDARPAEALGAGYEGPPTAQLVTALSSSRPQPAMSFSGRPKT
ncbi:hypothetical protein KZX45_09280 [Georgenia sp. EYE_87]|uniref:hypothetical protein n=1 Tax=Georgenia sp. EYE_87 TaxID=2853448 RepID=UPI00200601B7|nr:hypothetical protein [Georgenia sp. EYE_87]MCK6210731.1 hypothetical protein [Georgenia sp. EYE_87]